jgi:ribosomal protein S18 acetylase RimI-like enzyme
MHPAIRKADVEDAGILSVLATEVWLDTYATEGISLAFASHLLEEYSPRAFTEALLDESIHIFVYTDGNFVKGYLKLITEPVALDLRYGTIEVATLYVRRHHKRQGIGTELLRRATDVAAEAGHRSMYLTVHHANRDALVFYETHGFHQAGDFLFEFEGIQVPNVVLATNLARHG